MGDRHVRREPVHQRVCKVLDRGHEVKDDGNATSDCDLESSPTSTMISTMSSRATGMSSARSRARAGTSTT
eukprot:263781-Heterocapsa_arctica.AAC.1